MQSVGGVGGIEQVAIQQRIVLHARERQAVLAEDMHRRLVVVHCLRYRLIGKRPLQGLRNVRVIQRQRQRLSGLGGNRDAQSCGRGRNLRRR